ncbi:MAG: hypothetical protein ACOCW2_02420 [Chitinivibrionales bacterium]
MSEKVVVYLHHPVDAFNLSPKQFTSLTNRFADWSFELVHSEEELLDRLPCATILLCWHMQQQWYARAPHLRVLATPAAGSGLDGSRQTLGGVACGHDALLQPQDQSYHR